MNEDGERTSSEAEIFNLPNKTLIGKIPQKMVERWLRLGAV